MARIKRIYLGDQPTQQPQLPYQHPPLALGDAGWAGQPPNIPQPSYQHTPPYGHHAPMVPHTGTTQIVYYPVPTAPLIEPQGHRPGSFLVRGCLLMLAMFILAGGIALLGGLPPNLAHMITQPGQPEIAMQMSSASVPDVSPQPVEQPVEQPTNDRTFHYDNPPSITRDQYIAIWCAVDSPACPEAGSMYDALVHPEEGLTAIDPAIEAGQAAHETVLGTAGVGIASIKNLHGVQCHAGDNRVGDSSVPWGNGCAAIYGSYTDSVKTWVRLLNREYFSEGRMTPEAVVAKYAPAGADGNNPPAYIGVMQSCILQYRAGRDRCDHGLPLAQAQTLGSSAPAAIAPEATVVSAVQQPRSIVGPRAQLTAISWVWDGANERIVLRVQNTSTASLTLSRDTLQVRSNTGTMFSMPTDGEPIVLAPGQTLEVELVIGAGPDQEVTITLMLPPDGVLTLQLDKPVRG